MRFRPCIDLHQGKVKQIVGSSLSDHDRAKLITNFCTDLSPSHFARIYRDDRLTGGHVIMLGAGNRQAAMEALREFPGGFQIGGGIRPDNAAAFLDGGASHVIITSYAFSGGDINWAGIEKMVSTVGSARLVLDISCRKKDGAYYVVTDRWQTFTSFRVTAENLERLSALCDEFLVHAVDVEGRSGGIDRELVALLAASPLPVTYAGGIRSLPDLDLIDRDGAGRVDATVGSALDIFGGPLSYRAVVDWHTKRREAVR